MQTIFILFLISMNLEKRRVKGYVVVMERNSNKKSANFAKRVKCLVNIVYHCWGKPRRELFKESSAFSPI